MDLHSLPALCQALALDPGRHGLHVASASAPTLDPATPTLLLDPLDDALLAAILDRYPADHPLRLARFDSDRVLLSDTTPPRSPRTKPPTPPPSTSRPSPPKRTCATPAASWPLSTACAIPMAAALRTWSKRTTHSNQICWRKPMKR